MKARQQMMREVLSFAMSKLYLIHNRIDQHTKADRENPKYTKYLQSF